MKLWLIWQTVNSGYDTYDSAVVAAEDEQAARHMSCFLHKAYLALIFYRSSWAKPGQVQVKLIGEAVEGTEAGVICASYNAG